MNQRWMRIGIGLFVVLALVLLGTLIVLFNSVPRLFRATTAYTAQFKEDVSGLAPGAPVRRSGVQVGVVGGMALDDATGSVMVRLDIDKPFVVRRNEQVTLTASLLGGDAAIDIATAPPPPEGQAPDTTPVPPEEVLPGVRAGNVSQLVARASEVVPTTQEAINDIRRSIQRIEKMTPLVEDTFREYRDLGHSLNNAMPDLRRTNDDVDKLAQSADKAMQAARDAVPQVTRDADDAAAAARALQKVAERVDVMLRQNQDAINQSIAHFNELLARSAALFSDDNVRNMTIIIHNVRNASETFPDVTRDGDEFLKEGRNALNRFNATLIRLDDLVQNLQKITKSLADRSDALARNLDEGLARFNRTVADLDQLLLAIGQADGTFNKLLTDASLYNHLDDLASQAAKAAPQFNLILKDLEVFADKLARHPESIGLGGVVRPGSGLKDPPTQPGLVVPPTHP
jgi:phospholipid/cholesterol/gamma-HCH transport system substrate-binding protein